MSFSFGELSDTANTWKDRHSKRWKFNLSLKVKSAVNIPWNVLVDSRSMIGHCHNWSRNLLSVVLF